MQVIDFSSLSLADLKKQAIALNAKIEGDRRLRATWIRAIELAQAAIASTAQAVDEFTGYPIAQAVGTTVEAMGEAYEIAHDRFVIPTEKSIAFCWNAATSEKAIRLYLDAAIALMRFCFLLYRSGMVCREWYDSLREESHEICIYEAIAAQVETKAIWVAKEIEFWVWVLDGEIHKRYDHLRQEARSLFSIAEWISFLIV